ncbi:hypothetical protein XENORESO_018046 [Xenotaenia resolanae]|uniref:Uncharacterized protein n=1 Tax=Xenotaenia resolanae TaxID=208358 RepID=A0ABV0WY10_9TELE
MLVCHTYVWSTLYSVRVEGSNNLNQTSHWCGSSWLPAVQDGSNGEFRSPEPISKICNILFLFSLSPLVKTAIRQRSSGSVCYTGERAVPALVLTEPTGGYTFSSGRLFSQSVVKDARLHFFSSSNDPAAPGSRKNTCH